jgi:hypothetical protein
MAETPEEAVALSDDDLDELVTDALADEDGPSGASEERADRGRPARKRGDADDGSDLRVEAPKPGVEGEDDEEREAREAREATDAAARQPVEGEEEGDEAERAGAPAAGEPKPFTYKAIGKEFTLPGAFERPDGAVEFKKEAVPQFRQALSGILQREQQARDQLRSTRQELARAKDERTDKDIEADAVLALFKDLRGKTDPNDIWKWAQDFVANLPTLENKVEKAKIERDRKALEAERAGPKLSAEEEAEAFTDSVQTELRSTFQTLFKHPDAKLLSQEEKTQLWQKWLRKAASLVGRADADDPQGRWKKGDLFFDDTDIAEDFADRVAVRKRAGTAATAAERNAALNADQRRGKAPPPTVGQRRPREEGTGNQPKKRDRKQFKEAFMAGKLDEQGED